MTYYKIVLNTSGNKIEFSGGTNKLLYLTDSFTPPTTTTTSTTLWTDCGTNYYDLILSQDGVDFTSSYDTALNAYCTPWSTRGVEPTYTFLSTPVQYDYAYYKRGADPEICHIFPSGYYLYDAGGTSNDRIVYLASDGRIDDLYVPNCPTTTTTTEALNYYIATWYPCADCNSTGAYMEIGSITTYLVGKYYSYGSNAVYISSTGGSGEDGTFSGMPGPYNTCIAACAGVTTTTTLAVTTTTTTPSCSPTPVITNITASGSMAYIYFTGQPIVWPYETYWDYLPPGGSWTYGGVTAYPGSYISANVGGTPTGVYYYILRNKCGSSDYSAWSDSMSYDFGGVTTTTTTTAGTTTTTTTGCHSVNLGYNSSSYSVACSASQSAYGIDTATFSTATVLYTSAGCSVIETDSGYYSDGTNYKYWDWNWSEFTSGGACPTTYYYNCEIYNCTSCVGIIAKYYKSFTSYSTGYYLITYGGNDCALQIISQAGSGQDGNLPTIRSANYNTCTLACAAPQ